HRGFFDPGRHFASHRAAGRGQRHFDVDMAVIIHVDLVDEAEFINVDRDFRIEHSLELRDEFIGQARELKLAQLLNGGRRNAVHHANIFRALTTASTKESTSASVLYRAKLARAVALTPRRRISGWAQWWPARMATPERSRICATSWGWAPFRLN